MAASQKRSGLSVEDWNALTEEDRDAKLDREVEIHKEINATLKTLEAMPPGKQREWLTEQGANLAGVKNGDLLKIAATLMNEKAKA